MQLILKHYIIAKVYRKNDLGNCLWVINNFIEATNSLDMQEQWIALISEHFILTPS